MLNGDVVESFFELLDNALKKKCESNINNKIKMGRKIYLLLNFLKFTFGVGKFV